MWPKSSSVKAVYLVKKICYINQDNEFFLRDCFLLVHPVGVSDCGGHVRGKSGAVLVAFCRSADVVRVLLLEDHHGTPSHKQPGQQRPTSSSRRQSETAASCRAVNLRHCRCQPSAFQSSEQEAEERHCDDAGRHL